MSDQPLIPVQSMPSDTNVRLSITGLAICEISKKPAEIFFLRDIPGHKLKMTIVKRERGGGNPVQFGPFEIPEGDRLSVQNENAISAKSYVSIPNAGEFELNRIINMRDLHDGRINYPSEGPQVTQLSIHDCSFSTLQLTMSRFQLVEHDGASRTPRSDLKKFGEKMVGKIKVNPGSKTIVQSQALEGGAMELLSHDEAGIELIYDIVITNNCDPDLPPCNEAPDFVHYYSVFVEETGKPGRTFSLEPDPAARSGEVSACNPVSVIPPK